MCCWCLRCALILWSFAFSSPFSRCKATVCASTSSILFVPEAATLPQEILAVPSEVQLDRYAIIGVAGQAVLAVELERETAADPRSPQLEWSMLLGIKQLNEEASSSCEQACFVTRQAKTGSSVGLWAETAPVLLAAWYRFEIRRVGRNASDGIVVSDQTPSNPGPRPFSRCKATACASSSSIPVVLEAATLPQEMLGVPPEVQVLQYAIGVVGQVVLALELQQEIAAGPLSAQFEWSMLLGIKQLNGEPSSCEQACFVTRRAKTGSSVGLWANTVP
eukprot:CAMPEP_0172778852 /NCGR_PEP_ID=MMETSP1074-20121228/202123_1 /TAXON_ID=2916 /ORGANISM="Ceratium fusus, Strain PA161109" /LENGTH=276 /DNA_ID=CAMNT_0013615801 /DNA_START=283 /DNA_END=1110 /DNA_ORIENTATION=+